MGLIQTLAPRVRERKCFAPDDALDVSALNRELRGDLDAVRDGVTTSQPETERAVEAFIDRWRGDTVRDGLTFRLLFDRIDAIQLSRSGGTGLTECGLANRALLEITSRLTDLPQAVPADDPQDGLATFQDTGRANVIENARKKGLEAIQLSRRNNCWQSNREFRSANDIEQAYNGMIDAIEATPVDESQIFALWRNRLLPQITKTSPRDVPEDEWFDLVEVMATGDVAVLEQEDPPATFTRRDQEGNVEFSFQEGDAIRVAFRNVHSKDRDEIEGVVTDITGGDDDVVVELSTGWTIEGVGEQTGEVRKGDRRRGRGILDVDVTIEGDAPGPDDVCAGILEETAQAIRAGFDQDEPPIEDLVATITTAEDSGCLDADDADRFRNTLRGMEDARFASMQAETLIEDLRDAFGAGPEV